MQYWWVIPLFIFIGGVCGFLFPRLRKPVYESTSVITTAIDYAYSGKLNDYEEDHLVVAVGDVISSSNVMNRVREKAADMGLDLQAEDIVNNFMSSRQGYRWELSTRFYDPQTVQVLNQVWLDTAMEALDSLRLASIESLKQLDAGESLEACFSQAVAVEPGGTYCDVDDFQSLLTSLSAEAPSADQDQLLTNLLISRISTSVTRSPSIPVKPVLFNTNSTTLAGAAIGLLAALAYFLIRTAQPAIRIN